MCCLRSLVTSTFCSREAKTLYDIGIKPKTLPLVSLFMTSELLIQYKIICYFIISFQWTIFTLRYLWNITSTILNLDIRYFYLRAFSIVPLNAFFNLQRFLMRNWKTLLIRSQAVLHNFLKYVIQLKLKDIAAHPSYPLSQSKASFVGSTLANEIMNSKCGCWNQRLRF